MYAWGWNSLENSAEIVQLCLRMRSQKNTSFMFSHKTLENTSWTPCFEAQNFNFPGWHWTFMKGKACAPVRESTWMSPDWEHRRNKQEHMRGRARFLQRSYEVYGSCLEFARQRKRDNELKKQWRQKWGRKSWRGEEETRSGGDMDTGQRVSVLWTSDLQAAELLCVCWESEPHRQCILPSLLLTSLPSLHFFMFSSGEPLLFPSGDILQFRKVEGWRASDIAVIQAPGAAVSHTTLESKGLWSLGGRDLDILRTYCEHWKSRIWTKDWRYLNMRGLDWGSSDCAWTNYWDNSQGPTLAISAASSLLPPKISGKEQTVEYRSSMISTVGENRLGEETFLILCTSRSLWGVASHHCYFWVPSD